MTGAPVSQLSGSANLPAAQRMIETADANLTHASHDTFEARAMVYAMLLSNDETVCANQTQRIAQLAEPGVPQLVPRMYQQLSGQDDQHKLLHLEQAMPTLKEMSRAQYQRFYDLTAKLIVADKAVDSRRKRRHQALAFGLAQRRHARTDRRRPHAREPRGRKRVAAV